MSLDIYLIRKGKFTYDGIDEPEDYQDIVFDINMTHNLGTMADACSLYDVLWQPESIGIIKAREALPVLVKVLNELKSNPNKYKKLNPKNGWGSYENLVYVVSQYVEACQNYPNATIEISG